jgi:hypothetical protein
MQQYSEKGKHYEKSKNPFSKLLVFSKVTIIFVHEPQCLPAHTLILNFTLEFYRLTSHLSLMPHTLFKTNPKSSTFLINKHWSYKN